MTVACVGVSVGVQRMLCFIPEASARGEKVKVEETLGGHRLGKNIPEKFSHAPPIHTHTHKKKTKKNKHASACTNPHTFQNFTITGNEIKWRLTTFFYQFTNGKPIITPSSNNRNSHSNTGNHDANLIHRNNQHPLKTRSRQFSIKATSNSFPQPAS